MNQRICKTCHTPIAGRRDKKFCSAKCRSAFNNEQYRIENRDVLALEKLKKLTRNQLRDVYRIFGQTPIPAFLLQNSKINVGYSSGTTRDGSLMFLDFLLCKHAQDFYIIKKVKF